MNVRLYWRAELLVWIGLTLLGMAVSALTVRELNASIDAIRRVAMNRPHAEDVIGMALHNRISEYGRLLAQSLFFLAGILALGSRPRRFWSPPRVVDRMLPWILTGVEAILVGNSLNEYLLSRSVLRRRAAIQTRKAEAK